MVLTLIVANIAPLLANGLREKEKSCAKYAGLWQETDRWSDKKIDKDACSHSITRGGTNLPIKMEYAGSGKPIWRVIAIIVCNSWATKV